MAQILDGVRVRDRILEELRPRIRALPRPPGLAVALVGHDPASEIYVRGKVKACAELGIYSEKLTPPETISTEVGHDPASEIYVRGKVKACAELGIYSEKLTPPETISTAELLRIVQELNSRPEIDGILVQMPLPPQVDSKKVLLAVSPEKDVDGFHPCNVGNLVTGRPGPRSCTPAGIIRLLKHYQIPISGHHAVVVGRSDIVGKPMAMLLLHENATVTICHSKTEHLAGVCRQGDILVAALGRPAALTSDFIRPGATVVDVGTTRITDREQAARIFRQSPEKLEAFDRKGPLLVGDVHPLDVAEKAGAYT